MKNTKLLELKLKMFLHLKDQIKFRKDVSNLAISNAEDSRNIETKSSVGDKYETSRAMMQIEIENNKAQLFKIQQLENELNKIEINKVNTEVRLGSLVITNENTYLISIGLGRILVENKKLYAISLESPIGSALKAAKIGDKINFQGREITILSLY